MPQSRRLRQVIARLATLEAHFLPPSFSLTGHYTKRQADHTKAYLLFVHAELESYFEDRAERLVTRAQEQWQRHARCTPLLSRVLLYHHATQKMDLEAISNEAVSKAVNAFLHRLKQGTMASRISTCAACSSRLASTTKRSTRN